MGMFDSFKSNVQETFRAAGVGPALPDRAFPMAPHVLPLEYSVARYRRQRGINLGAWFTTEGWLNQKLYKIALDPRGSDFDLARSRNKAALEHHWDTWVTEEDWQWIKDKGFNSVRLPIGYYHLTGPLPEVVKGTPYEPYADVFAGAWQRIIGAVESARKHGLGIMIDLHAAPGGQNTEGHSGVSTGKIDFWKTTNLNRASLALRFLASTFVSDPTVLGLEILNEPRNSDQLTGWYETTLNELRPLVGRDFPIYVHDTWDMDWYCPWAGRRDDMVVIDHHLYRCYTDEDRALTGPQHADKLAGDFLPKLRNWVGQTKGAMVIGEWSGGLADWELLPKDTPTGERDAHKRKWVMSQLDTYDKDTAGYYFWTLKSDADWDPSWSAKNASQAEILPATVVRTTFRPPPQGMREAEIHRATDQHVNYWNGHGGMPDPAAFSAAFARAWDDALMFLLDGSNDELAFVWHWSRRRREEYEMATRGGVGGLGGNQWQWDEAFKQGLKSCTDAARVQ